MLLRRTAYDLLHFTKFVKHRFLHFAKVRSTAKWDFGTRSIYYSLAVKRFWHLRDNQSINQSINQSFICS